MKKKVLLSSIATIALCLCLIAGSTFALFTDSTNFNIAVTAGDIEILATSEISGVYSAKKHEDGQTYDEFLIDEYGNYYYHEEQSASYEKDENGVITKGVFSNGGDVKFVDGKLTFNRITPGDRVDVTINVENKSDVAFVYRYKLISNNTNLATGMVVTIDETSYESLAVWTSDWKAPILAPDGKGGTIDPKTISIELPVYAGNEYQSEKEAQEDGRPAGEQSVEYTIIVEAVQANAITTNEEEFQIYQKEAISNVAPTLDQSGHAPGAQTVLFENLYLTGNASIAIDQSAVPVYIFRNMTTNVQGTALVMEGVSPMLLIYDCDFNVNEDEGQLIMETNGLTPLIQISNNCTINGVAISTMTENEVKAYFGIPETHALVIFPRNVETE